MHRFNTPRRTKNNDSYCKKYRPAGAILISDRDNPPLAPAGAIVFSVLITFTLVLTAIFIFLTIRANQSIVLPSVPSATIAKVSMVPIDRLLFTCPTGPKSVAANDNEATGLISEFYAQTNGERNGKYMSATPDELRNVIYDGWSLTFDETKKRIHDWKVEQFTSALHSGDVIYESACGEGFNLAMTLQIIYETANIERVTVYGNDYLEKSVEAAHRVLELLAPSGTRVGAMCAWDSTDLRFVPANTFDLAYTGYIDQLVDPYNIFNSTTDGGTTPDKTDMCTAYKTKSDWAKVKLVDMDQKAQEDWYAKWVSELVRIVKPGKLVLIENVGLPYCDDIYDWGGVSREWWALAVSKYKWDIDVDSIQTKGLAPTGNRYNVSMRKNTMTV